VCVQQECIWEKQDVSMKSYQLSRNERSGDALIVTALGLGLAALGRPGYINLGHARDLGRDYASAAMEAHAHDVLDAAWAAGVRYFDAARSYGRAEAFLVSWLHRRAIAADAVTVGSKWGYTYTANWQVDADVHEVKEHSLPVLRRQILESRGLLGAYLKLYQIHSATLESGVLENSVVLAELAQLRETGLVIGLSLSGPAQARTLEKAMTIVMDGKPLFGAVQATWNLLDPSAGEMLAAAHRAGMGVIVKEALANGRLTARNDDPTFAAQRRALEEIATSLSVTIDALALAAVLNQEWATVVLSGAATVDQLKSNVTALQVAWSPGLAAALAGLAEAPADYWASRGRLAWN
jgi:aryl-alcohol dehydrogenase-like predicted oxidoreductase